MIGQTVAVSKQVSHWYILNTYRMPVGHTCVVEVTVYVDYISALEVIGKGKGQLVL